MDVADILPAIATAMEARNPKPGSVFVVGSKSAVCSVKAGLEKLIDQPVIVPEEPEFALARGAALAAANVPCADASTCGLAYSRDPDELSAADRFSVKPADADTQAAVLEPIAHDGAGTAYRRAVPWPPISFSSAVAAALVVGGVSVAMLVAANVAGTADRGAVAAEAADSSALLPLRPSRHLRRQSRPLPYCLSRNNFRSRRRCRSLHRPRRCRSRQFRSGRPSSRCGSLFRRE